MNRQHRNFKLKPQLESMDTRIVPSAMSVAMAHARAQMAAAAQRTSFSPTIHYSSPSHVTSLSRSASVVRLSTTKPATVTPNRSTLAATTVSNSSPKPASATTRAAATTDIGDVKNGPLAKAGQDLIAIYQEYQSFVQAGGTGTFTSSRASVIMISGTSVKLNVRGTGNIGTLAGQLGALGMRVESTDARTGTVEGFAPISQLVNIAQMTQVTTVEPVYKPMRF